MQTKVKQSGHNCKRRHSVDSTLSAPLVVSSSVERSSRSLRKSSGFAMEISRGHCYWKLLPARARNPD